MSYDDADDDAIKYYLQDVDKDYIHLLLLLLLTNFVVSCRHYIQSCVHSIVAIT